MRDVATTDLVLQGYIIISSSSVVKTVQYVFNSGEFSLPLTALLQTHLRIKVNLHKFSEATGIVVSDSLGISKSF